MRKISIEMEEGLYEFYKKAGNGAGKTAERMISEILSRFADESSLTVFEKGRERWRYA